MEIKHKLEINCETEKQLFKVWRIVLDNKVISENCIIEHTKKCNCKETENENQKEIIDGIEDNLDRTMKRLFTLEDKVELYKKIGIGIVITIVILFVIRGVVL